ncbi:MAG: type II secretion system protein [Planctomycetes bacterium]|nr:type II secretion system protein [Planctomycetota bacterium]
MSARNKSAFTLMELLVVISIIALLLSIMTPSLRKAREQGKRAVCMANLHAIGMALHVYAVGNDDELVASDSRVSWEAWGEVSQPAGCATPTTPGGFRQVNLGHLMATTDIIPLPSGKDHVFFCPSGKAPNGGRTRDEFEKQWGRNRGHAATSYMYNDSLDGIDDYVQAGDTAVLSHVDVVQYVLGDASAHSFNNRPLIYDTSFGPERLQEVSARYGVCFPNALLHKWLAKENVDMHEARQFLSDPTGWASNYQQRSGAITLANVPNVALASDVVGVWGGKAPNPPSG